MRIEHGPTVIVEACAGLQHDNVTAADDCNSILAGVRVADRTHVAGRVEIFGATRRPTMLRRLFCKVAEDAEELLTQRHSEAARPLMARARIEEECPF